ncbi:hypothetical protein HPB50_027887 [Hyalomma asiaticum]|nr:hypothetical protein HPB50_027887 [Hyalomma asiaticum]
MQASFSYPITRLLKAGFPQSVIRGVAESVHQKVKNGLCSKSDAPGTDAIRLVVVPDMHKISHNL